MNAQELCATRVHIYASPLLRAGLEQIFDDPHFIVSDVSPHDLSQPSAFDDAIPRLFIVDEKHCSVGIPELIAETKAHNPSARVVLLADRFELDAMVSARRAGVDGFCLTTSSRDVLIHSIALVLLGEIVVPSEQLRALFGDGVQAIPHQHGLARELPNGAAQHKSLSSREIEVLGWLKEGAPNKVIARKLDVAEATVKVHVKAILRKIGVVNRSQAALWAAYHLPLEAAPPKQ